jgi:hypothetical protein
VFVSGDFLLQLRNDGGDAQPPRLTLTSAAAPETALATLPLESLPVVGADLHEGRLYVVQAQADSWRNDPVAVTNRVVQPVPQPPLRQTVTNTVVETVPQPPLVSYVTVTNIIVFRRSPGIPCRSPTRPTFLNVRFSRRSHPCSFRGKSWRSMRSASHPAGDELGDRHQLGLRARAGAVAAERHRRRRTSALALAGQTTLGNPTNYYGAPLVALWPQEGVRGMDRVRLRWGPLLYAAAGLISPC